MQRLAPVVSFVLALFLAGLLEAPPVHAVDATIVVAQADAPKGGGQKEGAAKAGRAKSPIRGGPKDETALWWNDPKIVKILSLTDEQRAKMDGYLKGYREKVPDDRRPEAFHEALVQGDWKNARIESEKVTKLAETAVRMRGELKINVLSQLNKEQLTMLVDSYPKLVYKPWRRAMNETPAR